MINMTDDRKKLILTELGHLKDFLQTTIETNGNNVKITAKNTAPEISDLPSVVFTGVSLAIGNSDISYGSRFSPKITRSKDITSINTHFRLQDADYISLQQVNYQRIFGTNFENISTYERQQGEILFPGQWIVWEMEVSPTVLPYLQFRVDGALSRRHLFHNEYTLKVPDSLIRPVVLDALKSLNELQIHNALLAINQDRVFDGNTTLSEIQQYTNSLTVAMGEIEPLEKKINEIFHKFKFNWYQAHLRAIVVYLESIKDVSKKLQEAISSVKPDQIHAEANKIRTLVEEAYTLNRETEEFMTRYQLSDDEVNYQYRFGIGNSDREAAQRLQVSFGTGWISLPTLAKRSLNNAERSWASGPNNRIESILDDLKVAAEQILFYGLWSQLESWQCPKEIQSQKLKFVNWKVSFNSDSQPDIMDYQRAIEFPITNEYLKAKGVSDEKRKWFIEQLPDSLYKLRKARNEAVHPDPNNLWTREKIKPFVEEYLGTNNQGTLQRMAEILFSALNVC